MMQKLDRLPSLPQSSQTWSNHRNWESGVSIDENQTNCREEQPQSASFGYR